MIHSLVKELDDSIDRVELSTKEVRDFVIVGRDVGNDTNAKVREIGGQIDQLTRKLMRVNSLEPESGNESTPPAYTKRPDLQETLCSFVGKSVRQELVRGRRSFKDANLVACHPTDGSIYDGRRSIPDHYTVRSSP